MRYKVGYEFNHPLFGTGVIINIDPNREKKDFYYVCFGRHPEGEGWHPEAEIPSIGLVKPLVEAEGVVDNVNSPAHYAQDSIECIDVIMQNCKHLTGQEGYLVGNCIKYVWRFKHKNGVEDLKKAQWYLAKLINFEEK